MKTFFANKKNIIGYLPCYNPEVEKEVICLCLIDINDILKTNDDIFITKNVIVLNIIDKHFNEYNSAVTIFDTDPEIITKNEIYSLPSSVIVFRKIKMAKQKIKLNKIVLIKEYNCEGNLIKNGTITNGLFDGYFKKQKYKDGVLFISP